MNRRWWILAILPALTILGLRPCAYALSSTPEIALTIGEPYEDMRKRSSAKIDPAIPNEIWYNIPKSDASLRFIDPQYGFMTPPARFFTISYNRGIIENITMSPQIKPLPLDDALKIALNLQDQWRKQGWRQIRPKDFPAFADNQQWRKDIQACKPNSVYWQADNKYQIHLDIACFQDDKHPDEARYLLTLDISKPWVK